MKRTHIYSIVMAVCVIGFWLFENFYTPEVYASDGSSKEGIPFIEELLPSGQKDAVVHDYYMLSYNERHEQAEWVAYTLDKSFLTYDDRKRPYFVEDPFVKTKSADWRNYKKSGYDRGHLVPAGDMRFSKQAYDQTFYTSNISPQDRDFNAGLWNRLEMKVRYWCKKYGTLYVITAGVLDDIEDSIGDEDVSVPASYYKIIARKKGSGYTALSFLMPNQERQQSLDQFLVPIDELEKRTGLDFFKGLPNSDQEKLESRIHSRDWDF